MRVVNLSATTAFGLLSIAVILAVATLLVQHQHILSQPPGSHPHVHELFAKRGELGINFSSSDGGGHDARTNTNSKIPQIQFRPGDSVLVYWDRVNAWYGAIVLDATDTSISLRYDGGFTEKIPREGVQIKYRDPKPSSSLAHERTTVTVIPTTEHNPTQRRSMRPLQHNLEASTLATLQTTSTLDKSAKPVTAHLDHSTELQTTQKVGNATSAPAAVAVSSIAGDNAEEVFAAGAPEDVYAEIYGEDGSITAGGKEKTVSRVVATKADDYHTDVPSGKETLDRNIGVEASLHEQEYIDHYGEEWHRLDIEL